MSEPARAEASAAPAANLDEHREARKPKAHRWTRWLREVKKHPDIGVSATGRQLLDELVARADNETGEWRLYLGELAQGMGRHERTVQLKMRELVESGLIEYKPGRSNPRTRSWFRLIPLEDRMRIPLESGAAGDRPWGDTAPPQPEQQAVASGAARCRPWGDTAPPLTAVPTTEGTEPPRPPSGGRQRDRGRWLAELRAWAVAESLPIDSLDVIAWALGRKPGSWNGDDRGWVAHYLEQKTAWRDPRSVGDRDSGDQAIDDIGEREEQLVEEIKRLFDAVELAPPVAAGQLSFDMEGMR